MAKPWQNQSGCNDPTAYASTRPTEEEIQVGKLVKAMRIMAELYGFKIVNRVELHSMNTGKSYR